MKHILTTLCLICVIFAHFGCAAMRDSKRYEMKKSPCACLDLPQTKING
ncbi:hypothetical protein HW260_00200 [Helicobacter cinaedi]|nr:hypothetical protein [Helicobacter cinaedi]QOQ90832.1 hypothetical protein HW260_00200 [Helicobacter cinaedi]BDB66092.1 hypothetical protein Hc94105_0277 [Helicobacter cinaedi]